MTTADIEPVRFTRGQKAVSAAVVMTGSAVLSLLTYWSAIFAEYARLDDYIYTYFARIGNLEGGIGLTYINAGRPVPAFVFSHLLPAIESVPHLSALRLVATLVLAIGAGAAGLLVLGLTGRRTPLEHLGAIGVAGVILTTTASPSAVTWVVMAGQLPALFFAVVGGALAVWARTWWHWLAAATAIGLCAFTYQHYTPLAFFVALVATATLWAQRRPSSWWRPVVAGFLVLSAMVIDFVFILQQGGSALDRAGDATVSQRVDWFVHELVPRTADVTVPWSLEHAGWSALAAAILLLLPATLGRRYLAVAAAVVIGWACTVLVLLPGEMWASYRLAAPGQIALWSGVALCVALTISCWSRRSPVVGWSLTALAAGVIAASMSVAHQRAVDYFAAPNVVDWSQTKCAVADARPIRPGKVVEQNDFGESTSPILSYDEYGITASSAPFAIQFLVWVALDAVDGPGKPTLDPSTLVLDLPGTETPGALVIGPDSCG